MIRNEYYENFNWENSLSESPDLRLLHILALIPADVQTILDVGCGNGVITNRLAERYSRVVGVDWSEHALNYVKTEKILAHAGSIPLDDCSFDLVLSTEVLEHLDSAALKDTVVNLKRLSKKYILITVPNRESLQKSYIGCPVCYHRYHRSQHINSFDLQGIESLFPGYKLLSASEHGIYVRQYLPWLAYLKHKLTSPENWIPYFWTKNEDRKSTCPKCHNEFIYPFKFNLIAFICDGINLLLTKKLPYWLFVLLEKQ